MRKASNQSTTSSSASLIPAKKLKFLGIFSWCFRDEASIKPDTIRRPSSFPSASLNFDKPPVKANLTSNTEITSPVEHHARHHDFSKVYFLDKVFILGDHYKMVAKITTKQISKPCPSRAVKSSRGSRESSRSRQSEDNAASDLPVTVKKEIFSMYDKGIKACEWKEITPEKVAEYIAQRLHCSLMVDALCGSGGNTIQFAKYCDYVLGIDIEPTQTLNARHNAQIYGVHHKIDFITVDFLKLKNLMGDVVFLGPSDIRKDPEQAFCIFEHADPDLRDLLAKSLEISYSIALKLPGDTDLEELAELFHVSLERHGLYSKRFSIEIERIVNSNNQIECIVVYFGDCSSIELREEYEAIYEYLAANEVPEWRNKFPFHTVVAILRNVGTRKFFMHIAKIEEQFNLKDSGKASVFQTFLDELVENNLFTKASLKKIIDDASDSRAKPPSLIKKRSSGPPPKKGNSQAEVHNKLSAHNENKLITIGNAGTNNPLYQDSLNEISIHGISPEKETWTKMVDKERAAQQGESENESSQPSYSVSSDYLQDSDNDSAKKPKKTRELINISFDGSERSSPVFQLPESSCGTERLSFKKAVSSPIYESSLQENSILTGKVEKGSK